MTVILGSNRKISESEEVFIGERLSCKNLAKMKASFLGLILKRIIANVGNKPLLCLKKLCKGSIGEIFQTDPLAIFFIQK